KDRARGIRASNRADVRRTRTARMPSHVAGGNGARRTGCRRCPHPRRRRVGSASRRHGAPARFDGIVAPGPIPFAGAAGLRGSEPSGGKESLRGREDGSRGIGEFAVKVSTIGFTKKSAKEFFELLRGSGARRVVDVRLNNMSQLAGFAKKDDL